MFGRLRDRIGVLDAAVMAPFERLRAALCDAAKREVTVAIVLAAYAGLWTLYDVLARSGEGIHADMGEMVAWSRDLALGSPKHPQMGAWIAGLWFSVFPLADWAFYLLANGMVALALWMAWRLSAGWLGDNKRVAGLALFAFIPFFNFFAWKYNANTILIPLWAVTTFWFVRSLETGSRWAAVFAGVAAACSMMGKYWSIFLLLGLGAAVLVSPYRRAYFRSASPWLTVAAGLLVIAPHLYWVATHGFPTIEYAIDSHVARTFAQALEHAAIYLSGFAAYIAFPLLLLGLLIRPDAAAALDVIAPQDKRRRFAAAAFWLPVLLPIPVALASDTALSAIWTMAACTLAPIVLLASPRIAVSPAVAARILAVAAIFSLSALAIAPARALRMLDAEAAAPVTDYRMVARAVAKQWRRTTAAPLALVGSYPSLVYGVSFYAADRPSILSIERPGLTPWVSSQRIDQKGIALVCPVDRRRCVDAAEEIARHRPLGLRRERVIARHHRGVASKTERFLIITIPPARTAAPAGRMIAQ